MGGWQGIVRHPISSRAGWSQSANHETDVRLLALFDMQIHTEQSTMSATGSDTGEP
jgi:hypothetical protein